MDILPEHIEAMYDCLRAMPPFSEWSLPEGEEIHFTVARSVRHGGTYRPIKDGHEIAVSSRCVSHFNTLAQFVAHEMIHCAQRIAGTETSNTIHNRDFKDRAGVVCGLHGWDQRLVFYD